MPEYKVVDSNEKSIKTNITLHPGEILADELEARNISKKDFAAQIALRRSHLSDLFNGRRHVSAKLALQLEAKLGIGAEFWLRVQTAYDLFMAKKELKKLKQ